jgi:hypothetical protein
MCGQNEACMGHVNSEGGKSVPAIWSQFGAACKAREYIDSSSIHIIEAWLAAMSLILLVVGEQIVCAPLGHQVAVLNVVIVARVRGIKDDPPATHL